MALQDQERLWKENNPLAPIRWTFGSCCLAFCVLLLGTAWFCFSVNGAETLHRYDSESSSPYKSDNSYGTDKPRSGVFSLTARPGQRSDRRLFSGLGSVLFPNSQAAHNAPLPPMIPSFKESDEELLVNPSVKTSANPSVNPLVQSSANPSVNPSVKTSVTPSVNPSVQSSANPSVNPSVQSSANPSVNPSVQSSANPSVNPSVKSSANPFVKPTEKMGEARQYLPEETSEIPTESYIPLVGPSTKSDRPVQAVDFPVLPVLSNQNLVNSPNPVKANVKAAPAENSGNADILANQGSQNQPDEIGRLLDKGTLIEQKKDWNHALNFWEKHLKVYPEDSRLLARYHVARIHYDISHRMADPAYVKMTESLTLNQAQSILIEVLNKLHTYYVDRLSWEAVSQSGLREIEIAFSDDNFRACFLSNYPAEQIDQICERWFEEIQSDDSRSDGPVSGEETIRRAIWLGQKGYQELRIPESVLVLEYLCGITNSLDAYSTFLTPTQLDDLFNQIEGNFVGLGVELKDSSGLLRIIRTINGSPAQKAGLLPGDIILAVDGKRTTDYSVDKCANMLQGEEGSLVCLEIARSGENKNRTVYVVRKHIDVASVENVHIIADSAQIGYLKINNFQKSTVEELDRSLELLNRQGMKQLIIDLRDNPGGLLQSAVEVSNRFISLGPIVSTRGKNPQEDKVYSATTEHTWSMPLTLLIDHNSASAAEIFAGAMRDCQRAQIVGTQSYGKGSVQGIFPLSSCNGGVRLTTAKFYSPLGKPFTRVGVKPSLEVRKTARMVNQEADPGSVATSAGNDSDFSEDESETWNTVPEKEDACIQAAIEAFANRQNSLAL